MTMRERTRPNPQLYLVQTVILLISYKGRRSVMRERSFLERDSMHTLSRLVYISAGVAAASFAAGQTYGNTSPFETYSNHSPDFVLGVQVTVPQSITLASFGLIYGLPGVYAP